MSNDDYTAETKSSILTQVKLLELAEKDIGRLLERNKLSELKRHHNNIELRLGTIQELKYKMQELMISHSEDIEKVNEFSEKMDRDIARFDDGLVRLDEAIQEIADGENAKGKHKADEEVEEKFQRRLYEERKIEEMRIQMKIDYENREERKHSDGSTVKVKLPKLVISKFEGTALDWFRFWNQFETEVDKQDISPVTKFSYLKEFLFPQVRKLIDGLPFTSEGYSRAKAVLLAKFGKATVVANAHVKCITSLPVVSGTNPNRIHEFFEKLYVSVQALDTMKKLHEINGYVKITLDKLPGIRADLVRLDDDWEEWGFPELTEALRKWTVRNPKIFHPDKHPKHDKFLPLKGKQRAYQNASLCLL